MLLTRREVLRRAGGAALALSLASACGGSNPPSTGDSDGDGSLLRSAAPLPQPFSLPLAIPPVLRPVRADATTDYYEITARAAVAEILPGLRTEVWGYNGSFPGPTIEARRGRRVVVRTRNELPVPIVTHLHGGHTPPESDGYPTDLVLPVQGWTGAPHGQHGQQHAGNVTRGTKEYVYPLEQRAATLWYHDHRMDFTGPQVWRGLAGFLLVRDEEDDALPLPKGARDVPLLIADRAFAADGALPYPAIDPQLQRPGVTGDFHSGVLGDVALVNGVPWPFFEVAAARYRLRLLNASNARRYRLALDPAPGEGAPFTQVGSDGGLLGAPQTLKNIYITPAARFDVVVDFGRYRPGTTVTLRNLLGDGGTAQIMQFRVGEAARDDTTIPATLSRVERLDPASATQTRSFAFNRATRDGHAVYRVNDRLFDPDFVAADPQLGATEVWTLTSTTHHPIHLHLSPFQVLERDGGLQPEDAGWKDTVRLAPRQAVRIVVRFDGYRGKYVFHCHNLEHEDMAMMTNFQVT
jgi:spore coat protein A